MREHMPLQSLIEPVVTGLGYEFVGVERSGSGRQGVLRVYIDNVTGIALSDCERVSRQLSGVLDVEDAIPGPYALEVSSPGVDRPLFTRAHFERFVGAQVKVRLQRPVDGRRQIRGRLEAVQGDEALIAAEGLTLRLPFTLMERARLDGSAMADTQQPGAIPPARRHQPSKRTRAKPR